jgi:hypothetical protein
LPAKRERRLKNWSSSIYKTREKLVSNPERRFYRLFSTAFSISIIPNSLNVDQFLNSSLGLSEAFNHSPEQNREN